MPLTLSDEKHTGKVNIMEITSSARLEGIGTLTFTPSQKVEEDLDRLPKIQKDYVIVLTCLDLDLLLLSFPSRMPRATEEATGQHQDAPSEVDAPQQPHDDDIEDPGE